jgi:NAD(P)-dependent dehydrogenase (short-subunit alcohol dehydrogenase family)
MSRLPLKTAVITGANSGIGKECARLLASRPGSTLTTIVLACRNEGRGLEAKRDLEERTGRSVFQVVVMDVADPASVQAALPHLPPLVDLLIMNAGGVSPLQVTPAGSVAVTAAGVTEMTADNLLGHVVLLEALLQERRLTTAAVYLGTEAACGVPKLGFPKPTFESSSTAEFVSVLNGSFFTGRKADQLLHYGQVKYLGALWMAALARKHPQLRLLTISPGNTSGTGAVNKLPFIMRILLKYFVMPVVMRLMGVIHSLETGSRRIVDSVDNASIPNGAFYASEPGKLSGRIVDQAAQQPGLRDEAVQNHAQEAIHQFL